MQLLVSLLLGITIPFSSLVAEAQITATSMLRFSTITTTLTVSSPKITVTMTTITTTGGVPTPISVESTTTTAAFTATTSVDNGVNNSTLYVNPTTHQAAGLPNQGVNGKLIGALFASGVVLVIFAGLLFYFGRKRWRKQRAKRISDWIEMNTGHAFYAKDGPGVVAREAGPGAPPPYGSHLEPACLRGL